MVEGKQGQWTGAEEVLAWQEALLFELMTLLPFTETV